MSTVDVVRRLQVHRGAPITIARLCRELGEGGADEVRRAITAGEIIAWKASADEAHHLATIDDGAALKGAIDGLVWALPAVEYNEDFERSLRAGIRRARWT